MPNYAIGDVQGCFKQLQALLQKINFEQSRDKLWFCGDLVNRGPHSLETLRFIQQLGDSAITVLGNHDFHLLAIAHGNQSHQEDNTLDSILNASDRETLLQWLRQQPLLHYDPELGYVMVHAGIYPWWNLKMAQQYANEVHESLISDDYQPLIAELYGNQPDCWDPNLSGIERLRFIINSFCRMRYCDRAGHLHFTGKGPIEQRPTHLIPWFQVPQRITISPSILFGHWASLECRVSVDNIYGLDSGCVWGNCLTAMRLEDKQRFSVAC